MSKNSYPAVTRVDATEKVLGRARYGADMMPDGVLYAVLVPATIGRGHVEHVDTRVARACPGVKLVLTHADMTAIKSAGFLMAGGYAFQGFQPMLTNEIAYRGQPIAVVVADTFENATYAASQVHGTYTQIPHFVRIDQAPAADIVEQAKTPLPQFISQDRVAGDADGAFARADVKVDARFTSPAQHHNPMELIATVAVWEDGKLTIHEGTQNAEALRQGLARQLGLTPEQVQVNSNYIGGGFGQKNSVQMQTVFAAVAARTLDKPVKLVVPREQIFHDASFRPASHHRVRLGADKSGKLIAAIHEADSQTSRKDLFPGLYADLTARLHGIDNFRGRERLIRTDTPNPGFMRSPWEHVASYAFESALDELAYALGQDPVALRLANDTTVDPITRLPLSSRFMRECLTRGAARFGWSRRSPEPGSMRDNDGTQIGWGVACGAYPTGLVPAVAILRASADGKVSVNVGGHDMGQGMKTAIANALSERLSVPIGDIVVEVGITGKTPQHLTAGSWGTGSAVPAALDAADKLLVQLRQLVPDAGNASSVVDLLKQAGRPMMEVEVRRKAPGQKDEIFVQLEKGLVSAAGPVFPEFASFSYITHFVEVRVEPTTRRIRVPRVVSVVDCGRVISPTTALSQVHGGVIWGIGAALREESEIDERYGGVINANFADYVIPVNADIGQMEVEFIDRPDPVLGEGIKSLGEVAMCGVAPAIANAVFHATGRRLRALPMRIEHLM